MQPVKPYILKTLSVSLVPMMQQLQDTIPILHHFLNLESRLSLFLNLSEPGSKINWPFNLYLHQIGQ